MSRSKVQAPKHTKHEVRIVRAVKSADQPYFAMSRQTAQDRSLSWAARGVLAYLLSKPDDWKVQIADLQQGCGRDKVYKILKELEERQYLTRQKTRSEDGKFDDWYYEVHELPLQPLPEKPDVVGSPLPEKPDTVLPDTANPTLTYKRESQNTESTSLSANTSLEGSQAGTDALAQEFEENFKPSTQLTAFQVNKSARTLSIESVQGIKELLHQDHPLLPAEPDPPARMFKGSERMAATQAVSNIEEWLKKKQVQDATQPSAHAEKEPLVAPSGYKFMTGTDSLAQIHLREDGKSLKAKSLCKATIAHRYNPSQEDLKHKPRCEACWKIATTPKASRVRQPQPWDAFADEIARVFFKARDRAGINAVMGRVGPILHGDKKNGRCDGILTYECERQKAGRGELDYQELVAFASKVWSYFQSKNPGKDLKDCAKVLDYWQACRVLQVVPPDKPKPVYHIRFTKDADGRDVPHSCYCEIGANHD